MCLYTKNANAETIPSVTIPTDIAMATFLVGFAGCVAIELAEALAAGGGGGGSCSVGAGGDPLGNSGKNGSSGLGNWGVAGGGGGGSVAGGGVVLSGKRGWWRILLGVFSCWAVKSRVIEVVGEAVVGCGGTFVKDASNERRMKKWLV